MEEASHSTPPPPNTWSTSGGMPSYSTSSSFMWGAMDYQVNCKDKDKGKVPLLDIAEKSQVVCGLPARPKSDLDSSFSPESDNELYFDGHGLVIPSPLRNSPSSSHHGGLSSAGRLYHSGFSSLAQFTFWAFRCSFF